MKSQVGRTSFPGWNDLVFDNRNKEYGAYVLRKAYGGRVIVAFAIALLTLALVMAFPAIKKFFTEDEHVETKTKTVKYTDLVAPPPIDKEKLPPPRIDLPPPIKTIKFVPPLVTHEQVVEDEIPPIDVLKDIQPAAQTNDGPTEVIFNEVAPEAIEDPGEDPGMIYTVVQQQAEFPGGFAAMMKFISQNMRYPSQARRMGTEGSVFIEFVVDQQGKISDAKVIKGIGAGCDEEAVRVVNKMPSWKPGKQNGRAVKSRFVLPLKFMLG